MNKAKKLTIRIKFPSTQNDPAQENDPVQENNPSNFHRGRIIGVSLVFILIMAVVIASVFYYFNQDNSADKNIKSPTVAESPDQKTLSADQDAAQSRLQNASNESVPLPDGEDKISELQGGQPALTEATDSPSTAESVEQEAAQSSLQNANNESAPLPDGEDKTSEPQTVQPALTEGTVPQNKTAESVDQEATQSRLQNDNNDSAPLPDGENKISEPQTVQPALTEGTGPQNKTAESVDQEAAQSSLQNEKNESATTAEAVEKNSKLSKSKNTDLERTTFPGEVEKSASQSDVYSTSPTEAESADKMPPSTEQIATQSRSQNTGTITLKEIENSSGQGAIEQTSTTATNPPVISPNNKNKNNTITSTAQKKALPPFKESKIEIFSNHIERFVIASSIQDNEPVGTISDIIFDDTNIAAVYAYSDINDLEANTIYYKWFLDGKELAKIRVDVGANRWRSYSSKLIENDRHGKWEIEIHSEEGNKLASIQFIY
ncbi:MAG: DUF2914 domain-containing protein [Psychromonas sp.]